ncbi:MAG TPA: hypothetical protein VF541_21550, partial [Longimicrobium sp.]
LPRTALPADTAWRYCDPGASLRLGFAPRARVQIFAARAHHAPAALFFAAPLFADGTEGAPVRMAATGRLYRAELDGQRTPLVGVRIAAQPAEPVTDRSTCSGVQTYLMPQ